MYVDLEHTNRILLETVPDINIESMLAHVFSGLLRLGLLEGQANWGATATMRPTGSVPADLPFDYACRVTPSLAGMELYGWACGLAEISAKDFITSTELLSLDVPVERPKVVFPNLPPKPEAADEAQRANPHPRQPR